VSHGRWTPEDIPDLTGRRAVVTGATSGLGEAVVLALARHGAEVLPAGRSEVKLASTAARVRREVPGATVHPLVVDLADLSSVRRAAAEASASGPVHLQVNDAGVMATPYHRTTDGFELQMATNVLGHFALTGLLLPQLVAGGETAGFGNARVVSVSSQAHRLARTAPLGDPRVQAGRYRRWPAYAQTTLASLLFTFELDRRARESGLPVTAVAAHPGLAATALMASGRRAQPAGRILDAAFAVLGQPPSAGALPLLMAATADLPGATYVGPGGPGEVRGMPEIVGASRLARDPEVARRWWQIAQEATGVVYP
jgi:NAD(P)-dependent dehydrogenase (short-subunit alcohol dehydrogenase family)